MGRVLIERFDETRHSFVNQFREIEVGLDSIGGASKEF